MERFWKPLLSSERDDLYHECLTLTTQQKVKYK